MALFETEQKETARELADLLRLAQALGQRLETETHGARYDEVREIIDLLHQARNRMDGFLESL